jgi:hypothetical protein
MPEANPYFEIQQLGDRVELRPSPKLISLKAPPAGWLFLCLGPVIFYYLFGGSTITHWLLAIGGVILLWLLTVYENRRLRQQATIPLTIAPGPYILHGQTLLSALIEYNSVQLEIYEYSNCDYPKMYNVILVPAEGKPVTLPLPYFGDLYFNTAVSLANDVARILQIPYEPTLMPPE